MSGFISYPYAVSVVAVGTVGGEFLAGETDAMGIDFSYHTDITKQHYISDLTTPANNYNSYPQGKLTYTSPSIKMTRQSDGVWRYANHNLCLQSQAFDVGPPPWSKSQITATADAASAPDGTATADSLVPNTNNTTHHVNNAGSSITGLLSTTEHAVSVFAKANGYNWLCINFQDPAVADKPCYFDLQNGVTGSAATGCTLSMTSAGGGWYYCRARRTLSSSATSVMTAFYVATADAGANNLPVAFAGDGTSGIYLWGAQVKRLPVNDAGGYTYATGYLATTTTAKYDLPYEWNAALASQGILIEEQRTNLITYSQQIDNAAWTKDNATISANATAAPDGSTTADKIEENNTTNAHNASATATISAAVYTWSIFVKPAERTWCYLVAYDSGNKITWFDLSGAGAVGTNAAGNTSTITAEANGWYRLTITRTCTTTSGALNIGAASGDNVVSYLGVTGNGIYAWGAQLELGAFPTSPIHTVAATVTRAVDNITLATSAYPHSNSVGTFVVAANWPHSILLGTYRLLWRLDDGTAAETHNTYITTLDDNIIVDINDGNVQQGPLAPIGNLTGGTTFKSAYAYAVNDIAAVVNGGTVATDATATMPTVTTLRIGEGLSATFQFNGYIRQLTYLARRATDGELQTRTT